MAEERGLYNDIAEEIGRYTGESLETVKQKHRLSSAAERDFGIFKHQNRLSNENVEAFYRKCNYYIYELPLWNAERNRQKYLSLIILPYLKKNKYKKVMDFGAGTGDLCIELSSNTLDITYCDIAERLYGFAEWRFKRRSLSIEMIKGLDAITEIYDCIFSFDAFEHIKNLPEMLRKLVNYIKPGGSLIFSGAFSGGTLHLEENEKYNKFRNIDMLMRNCGLVFQDKFAQFYFYKLPIFRRE